MRSFIVTLAAVAAIAVAGPAFATPPNLCDFNPSLPQCDSGGGDNGGGSTNTNTNSADGGSVFGSGNSHAGGGDASATGGAGGNAQVGVGPVGNNSGNSHVGVGIGPLGNNSGNSRNHNDSSASVGDVGAFSGVDFEDATFGNSRNSNSVSGEQNQRQGQQQGQIQGQINAQGQDTDQANAQDTNVDVDARDQSSTVVEDRKDPVASAAPVFASACSAGISAQSYGFGGALANTNPMCDLALAVELAIKVDNFDLANELVDRAARFAKHRSNPVRMYGQWIPFIGQLF